MKEEFVINDKKIILIGTAHISKESIVEVEEAIEEYQPDSVCVELCASRFESIRNADRWKQMDIVKVVKDGKAPMLMANLILTAFQKKMGDKLGVKPGAEMIAAIDKAEEVDAEIVLADRDMTVTLKRAWGGLSFWEKTKLMFQILFGIVDSPDITEEEVESLKQSDMLTEAIEAMSKELPGIRTTLIDERDQYLAAKISDAPGSVVVAAVGAAHVPGIKKHLGKSINLSELEVLPPTRRLGKYLKWIIPMIIIGLIGYGFWGMNTDVSLEMIKRWILANGVLSAIGAAIAGGHILTILAAFVAAPITSLNPTIAAGWVSGLTEAWIRKPKVKDFENLATDITSVKGFRKNVITRILLVVVLSNLGSTIGTIIGIPLITKLLL